MKNIISALLILLLISFSDSSNESLKDTLLVAVKSISKQKQLNQIKILHKDIYRFEIMPIAFTPIDTTLPSLTKGHIFCYDIYGGVIWTSSKKNDSIKPNDSAYAVIKSWSTTNSDTSYKVLWFKLNSQKQWYRIK